MEQQNSVDWPCPKCQSKGVNNQIKLKQVTCDKALYICEGKQCLYPLEALKKFPIINREVGSIPPTKELLETLNLPLSLMNEVGLNESHLNSLTELNSLKQHVGKIRETKEAWESLIELMTSEGESVPSEFMVYRDADIAKFDNIQPELLPFVKHILSDPQSNCNS